MKILGPIFSLKNKYFIVYFLHNFIKQLALSVVMESAEYNDLTVSNSNSYQPRRATQSCQLEYYGFAVYGMHPHMEKGPGAWLGIRLYTHPI